ncbi:hypothetical protein appser2_14100 [Actinobacillus pleuropneumoniae serovar 2 str. S1536]|nr:hypothetical protein appser2_14100 [Actinobacillus pleuropneumoniae serovar 2 str. S1536]
MISGRFSQKICKKSAKNDRLFFSILYVVVRLYGFYYK